ncbi:MAG: type VI secretion system baseplate subunit TssE [Burkholderiales bacterium]
MAELTQNERLQPSLLDRLTDDEPEVDRESRDKRVLSMRRLRECVLRDLSWLLNATRLDVLEDLEDYPLVARSVVNYGMPDVAGLTASGLDVIALERAVREAIIDFEPRILASTVKVTARSRPELMAHNTLAFDIEGELWAQPVPLRVYLKTELDLEIGEVKVSEISSQNR